jgi:hypothetical protein
VGIALIAAIVMVVGGLLAWAFTHPVSIWTFLVGLAVIISLGVAGLVIYWISGLVRSVYTLDRNMLIITWGPYEQVIPASDIERVVLGSDLEGKVRYRGVRWPGYWVGYGEIEGIGPTLFYATEPPPEQIFIVTEGLAYGISPEEREAFLTTLQTRLQMGPTQIVEPKSISPPFTQWAFWRDRWGQGLLIGSLIALVALLGLLMGRFPALPRLLPLHFDAAGDPDRLGPRGQIFFVPAIGGIVFLVNGALGGLLYRRERLVSLMLWGGSMLVEILLWAAVLGILTAV